MNIINFWLYPQKDRKWIASQYAKRVKDIESITGNISHLCFVKKENNGLTSLFWDIGGRLMDKKCFTYNQNPLPSQQRFLADAPLKKSNVCILYDIRENEQEISDIATNIKKEYKCKVNSVVLIYDFLKKEYAKDFLIRTIISKLSAIEEIRGMLSEKIKGYERFKRNLGETAALDSKWADETMNLCKYAGEWVAIFNKKVVAHNADIDIVRKTAVKKLAIPLEAITLKCLSTIDITSEFPLITKY